MNKDQYKKQYENFSIEYLLELKARGSALDNEAHLAIEEILKDEGISAKNIPTAEAEPIYKPVDKGSKNFKKVLLQIVWGIVAVLVVAFANATSHTGTGMILSLVFISVWIFYKIFNYFKNKNTSKNLKEEI